MRLWTIHPQYLDTKGLLAAWREGLLAQKVLLGQTRGYTRHPQLRRFQTTSSPTRTIASYLAGIANEAERRGYKFNRAKIGICECETSLVETRGQLLFEWSHLKRKLRDRAPRFYRAHCKIEIPQAHPLFRIVAGPIQDWEKTDARKERTNRISSKRRGEQRGKRNVSSRS
jgi:pyrimidine dimer DNA glycosylase